MVVCVDSYVCGFCVYKEPWSPLIGEENLEFPMEKKNDQDEHLIAIYCSNLCEEIVVGKVPQYLSKLVFKCVQLPSSNLWCKNWEKGKQRSRTWAGKSQSNAVSFAKKKQ